MDEVQKIVDLGQLVLRFARVRRVTYHEDGTTRESDTDHTVMLGVISCALAAKLYPRLDVGKIAEYALVHDLVEAYVGDTPSFNISDADKVEKIEREKKALRTLEKQFAQFPWIAHSIEKYETLADAESRFVKTLDKCMPKITHILNNGSYFKQVGTDRIEMIAFFEKQYQTLEHGYSKEFPELLTLIRSLMDSTITASFGHTG